MSYILDLAGSCNEDIESFENFLSPPTKGVRSNIIAMALVKRGALAGAGVTETLLSNGGIDADDVIDKVRTLQLICYATFFPLGTINGSMPKPEELKKSQTFGLDSEPRATGEVKMKVIVTYDYFYSTQTVKWFNQLRGNKHSYDLVYWTSDYVHVVLGKQVNFSDIGYAIEGDVNKHIVGDFSAMYFNENGQDVPYGKIDHQKLIGFTGLTIAAPTVANGTLTPSNCAADADDCIPFRFTGTSFTGSLQFAVAETTSCLEWSGLIDCTDVIPPEFVPSGIPIAPAIATINPETGLLKLTGLGLGVHRFTMIATIGCGLVGKKCIEITVKA